MARTRLILHRPTRLSYGVGSLGRNYLAPHRASTPATFGYRCAKCNGHQFHTRRRSVYCCGMRATYDPTLITPVKPYTTLTLTHEAMWALCHALRAEFGTGDTSLVGPHHFTYRYPRRRRPLEQADIDAVITRLQGVLVPLGYQAVEITHKLYEHPYSLWMNFHIIARPTPA